VSAKTAALAETPSPWGSPAGPGLWRHKSWKLPDYVEQVSKGIMKSGRAASESEAIHMALGVLARWARGGGKVSPEVQAAAAKAIAEFAALKAAAAAHAHANDRPAVELAYDPAEVRGKGGEWGFSPDSTKARGTASATARATASRDAKAKFAADRVAWAKASGRPAQAKTLRRGDHVIMPGGAPLEVTGARHAGKKTTLTLKDPDTGEVSQKSVLHGTHVTLIPKGAESAAPTKTITEQVKAPARTVPAPRAAPSRDAKAKIAADKTARAEAKPKVAPETVSEKPAKPAPAGRLEGPALWSSGEGMVRDVTPAENAAAKQVWFRDTFSYTNDYLRHGTPPSASAAKALHDNPGKAKSRLTLPAENDTEYLRNVHTTEALMNRAPAFSRPATMYRAVTSPDQVFGPVGSMKGRTFTDHGFMSATTDKHTAEQYGAEGTPGKIVINVPAGGKAFRSQRSFSPDYAREKEYTFPPDAKFTVDDDRMVNGTRQTTVTLAVPPGAKPGPRPAAITPAYAIRQEWDKNPGTRYNVETGEPA